MHHTVFAILYGIVLYMEKGDQHRMIDGMTLLQHFEFVSRHVGDGFKLFRDNQKIAICWFLVSDIGSMGLHLHAI